MAKSKKVNTFGTRSVVSWFLGLLVIVLGIVKLSDNISAGLWLIVAGLIALPIVWDFAEAKLNFRLSNMLRFILFVVFVIIALSLSKTQ